MIELLTVHEMAEADRLTIEGGTPGIVLMERAGQAVADAAAAGLVTGVRIVVAAGPGNNGGDGFVAARLLAERGYGVQVLLLGELARLAGDAAEAAKRWNGATLTAGPAALSGLGDGDLIIDALFGTGLARPLEGAARAVVEAVNASPAPILAIDLPSGISGDSGQVLGAAVKARQAVTFFRRKPGHLLLPGRIHCGRVSVADIGIGSSVLERIKPTTFANAPELWGRVFPVPRIDGHKYSRGHVVVVSGGIAGTGAARLAARGSLRAGAGLVTIASPREALAVNAAATLAIMVRPVDGADEFGAMLQDRRLNVVVLGPGGGVGEGMRTQALAALAGERAVVLDADALTSFVEDPQRLFGALRERGNAATVLTPHDDEFARLFKLLPAVIDVPSKLEKVVLAAHLSGAVVLLKGADTVIAAPDGRAAISDNAPPWLATAGSGDVLAGMISGLLAQGMPGFEAACTGVWLHGETGNEVGPGLISEDLPEALPEVLRRLIASDFDYSGAINSTEGK